MRRVGISINIVDKLSSTGPTLGAETHKKCCHVDILKGVVFLAIGLQCEDPVDKLLHVVFN
jgi:hypothetical protein